VGLTEREKRLMAGPGALQVVGNGSAAGPAC
jgi:hypothetical protein